MDKVIFWDFDGTLVHPNQRFVDALDVSLRQSGYIIERESIVKYLKTIFPWLNYDKSYQNQTSKWWDNFLGNLTPFYMENKVAKEDFDKINLTYKQRITTINDYVLYNDTKMVLKKCVEFGYKNYLLSNNYPELPYFVQDLGLTEYFSGLIVSSHIGYEKPRQELYDYAKKLAKCNSGIMVGDNPNADILGGKQAGLKAVFVHNQNPSQADYTFNTLKQILQIL